MALTVLVVDDEPDILDAEMFLVRNALPGIAVNVEAATSGDEALRVLARRRVDLIVADYRMPGMDGVELLRQAGAMAPGVPRVLVSAYPPGSEPLAKSQSVAEFTLAKPFSVASFHEVMRAALGRRRATR